MELVHNTLELEKYLKEAVEVSDQKPILLDGYLTDAVEVDVDVISDGDAHRNWRNLAAYRASWHPFW